MPGFDEYLAIEKREQIRKATVAYLLFGIPVILFFTLSDEAIVGIGGTLKWRIAGLVPMAVAACVYIGAGLRGVEIGYSTGQLLLTFMIAGVTVMMSAIFYIVTVNEELIGKVGLVGTVAGNLLAVFVVGTLRAVPVSRVAAALIIPYSAMAAALLVVGGVSPIQWVFAANVLAAVPLVLIIINQREKTDNARLLAGFKLEQERQNLEAAVKSRTEELEILLRELHHRVRNNLQIILSIISLYEDCYSSAMAEDRRFNMIRRAVQMMSDAHSLSYNEHVIEKINMRHFFEELCSENRLGAKTSMKFEIDDIFLDLETAVVLGFISIHLLPGPGEKGNLGLRSAGGSTLLTISVSSEVRETSEDYRFAILLAELIRAEIRTVSSGDMTEVRISVDCGS